MADKPNFYKFEIGKAKALPTEDEVIRVRMSMGVRIHRISVAETIDERDALQEDQAIAVPSVQGGFCLAYVRKQKHGETHWSFYAENDFWYWPLVYELGVGWKADACISKRAMEKFDA
jgi:hypothetical protein